jgi:hypothetical protein
MENGGLESLDNGQPPSLSGMNSDNFPVNIQDARMELRTNNFFTANEYRVGKTVESEPDTAGIKTKTFIPRVGFIYEFEFSDNKRKFVKDNPNNFFENIYADSTKTNDSVRYNRITNVLQIKFYEASDRKFTFGKRAYIGNDQLWYNISTSKYYPEKYFNTFVGGGIFRNAGRFWQWQADGKIYLTGYRAGQTEFSGFINKPACASKDRSNRWFPTIFTIISIPIISNGPITSTTSTR